MDMFKNFVIAMCLAALAFFGYQGYVGTPQPQPTPLPTITATPTPSPTPGATTVKTANLVKPAPENAYAPPLASSIQIKLAKGEATGRILKVDGKDCLSVQPTSMAGVKLSFFTMVAVKTTSLSFQGAKPGDHYDPLIPLAAGSPLCPGWVWVDVELARDSQMTAGQVAAVEFGGFRLEIQALAAAIPTRPTVPLYIGLQPYATLLGHKMPKDSNVTVQGPLVKLYVDLLRAHRIEPMGQALASPPAKADGLINLDQWSVGSFRQLVIDGAISPPGVLFGPFSVVPWSPNYAAWEKTIKADPGLAGAWAYLTDEPCDKAGCGNNADPGMLLTAARTDAAKAGAPSLLRMVTHDFDARLPSVNRFVPSFEQYKKPTPTPDYWMYGACNSHGSCANGFTGPLSGTPDLMLEQPTVHYRAFPFVAAALGAKASLYYVCNVDYGTKDPWVDQYSYGGNGDGTLVYPGIPGERGFTAHAAIGSIRLKLLRQGQFDIEHAVLGGKLSTLAPDQYKWSRDNAAYDALR